MISGTFGPRRPWSEPVGRKWNECSTPASVVVTAPWWTDPVTSSTDTGPVETTERVLGLFEPAVGSWFRRTFPKGPTEPQVAAWPLIAAGRDVLVASPTGTGKTLT